jgi:hypothetical protein
MARGKLYRLNKRLPQRIICRKRLRQLVNGRAAEPVVPIGRCDVSGIVLLIGAFRLSSAKQEVLNAVRSARA